MTAGHSPFDIDPTQKQAQAGRNVPYEFLVGIVIVLVVGFCLYAMARYERAKIVAGPLVQARPDGSLLVAWRAAGGNNSHLEVNLDSTLGGTSAQPITIEPTVVDGQYVAPLPGTLINYPSPTYTIRSRMLLFYRTEGPCPISQPRVGSAFRFVAFGESGGALRPQTMAAAILHTQPHLVLHIGDLICETGEWPGDYDTLYRDQFYKPYSILTNIMPFMPIISGHEARIQQGAPFRRFFVLPRNGPDDLPPELNYWFDYGSARFVAIDTSVPADILRDKTVPWLQKVLGGSPTGWKFVFMHRSAYTGGQENPPDETIRQVLVPQFEALGVDMVFSACNHLYERTYPLRGGKVVPAGEGIVYITTGAGGRGLCAEKHPPPEYVAAFEDRVYSFSFVELVGGRMHIRQVGEYGELLDDWWFAKPVPAGNG